ncbi:MAG: hypothetical protein WAT66_08085 [Actinomycetota bacterium]
MTQRRKLVAILAFAAALATLAACGNDETPRAGATSPSPSPSPTETTFTEAEFTITTPNGWTRADATSSVDAKKAVRYSDAAGNYFIVALDPDGSDFAPDAVWRYAVSGSRFTVARKEACQGPPPCSTTDPRYDVYLMWEPVNQTAPKVAGHTWYFILGNTKSTTIDESLFERIVESIVVTS